MGNEINKLKEFWNEINEEYINNYIKELSNVSFIPFIGSGMSYPFGYPTWSNFLSDIIHHFHHGDKKEEQYNTMLTKEDFLKLANDLNQELGEGVVEEQVRTTFSLDKLIKIDEESNYLSLIKKSSIHTFITTNFDPVIETCMGISSDKIYLPSNMTYANDVENAIRNREKCVIKLHGTADRVDSIILTKDAFFNAYKSDNTVLKNVVEYFWRGTVLLFLGCGLKNDYLIEHFRRLAGPSKSNWHYAILPYPDENDLLKFRRDLASLKIKPIWYENGKYKQINTILEMIANFDISYNTVEYKELLSNLYQATINYREALKQVDIERHNIEIAKITNLLNQIYYVGEKNKICNIELATKANMIVEQFNKYVPYFNAFAKSTDMTSPEAQLQALHAKNEFHFFVDLIIKQLSE